MVRVHVVHVHRHDNCAGYSLNRGHSFFERREHGRGKTEGSTEALGRKGILVRRIGEGACELVHLWRNRGLEGSLYVRVVLTPWRGVSEESV